jgi:hypothetical protein
LSPWQAPRSPRRSFGPTERCCSAIHDQNAASGGKRAKRTRTNFGLWSTSHIRRIECDGQENLRSAKSVNRWAL